MIHHGDCLDILKTLPDASVDAVVTDPPYGLAFMGKRWDYDVPAVEVWAECLRVLKPGGHLLCFAGTRTQHRMAVRIEDAGFEIRDMIAWVYASGFPKSLDVSKAIDKAAGAEREVVGQKHVTNAAQGKGLGHGDLIGGKVRAGLIDVTAPATDAARQWAGWGTALKPALEPITVARKPLVGTVAENVLQHGTGAMNIDGCRVGSEGGTAKANIRKGEPNGERAGTSMGENISFRCDIAKLDAGRWPANLIHDGSEEVLAGFPETKAATSRTRRDFKGWKQKGELKPDSVYEDGGGSAARFFYCAKASKRDRDEGLEGFEAKARPTMGSGIGGQPDQQKANNRNVHPTVKPTDLMRYLCRLVTPPGGVVLDPFAGSGSTGKACAMEGFQFIGIEREAEYVEIAKARISHAVDRSSMFAGAT